MSREIVEPPLPDTTKWQPKADATFRSTFLERCLDIEKTIKEKVEREKKYNQHNFDSGAGVEDIIRDAFSQLLPRRYSVRAGTIVDADGNSSNDSDLIIFNDFWFPIVKDGATTNSRRTFLPIDGVYSVGEVKQTLDYSSLDKAMEKLVTVHRLQRPTTSAYRPTENSFGMQCQHFVGNHLYSFIIATDLKKGIESEKLINRFVNINKTLKRLEVVQALCILGHETVTWAFRYGNKLGSMIFQKDLYLPLIPTRHYATNVKSVLYPLMADLLLRLNLSVLAAEDMATRFGFNEYMVSVPDDREKVLQVDEEWLAKKEQRCGLFAGHDFDVR